MASGQYDSRLSLTSSNTLHQPPSFNPYNHGGYQSDIELQGLVEKNSGTHHSYNSGAYPVSPYGAAHTPAMSPGVAAQIPLYGKTSNPQGMSSFAEEPEKTRPSLTNILYMPMFLILAVGVAAGHHFFNAYLHSKPITTIPAVWAIRAGTALAFGFKTVVAVAVGTAYLQRMWATLRKRNLTVSGIDALFGGANHVQGVFLSGELWMKAKLAVLMAFGLLILPLSSVFTPATLTVINSSASIDGPCAIPSGDISNPVFSQRLAVIDGGFYTRPSPLLLRAATQAIGGQSAAWTSPCGTNCTYNYQFQGLTLNCTVQDPETTSAVSLGTTEFYKAMAVDGVDETGFDVTYLQLKWSSKGIPGGVDNALICFPWVTTFDMAVKYTNSKQSIEIKSAKPANFFGKPQAGSLGIPSGEPNKVVLAAIMDSVFSNLEGTLETSDPTGTTNQQIVLSDFVEQSGTGQRSFQLKDVKGGIETVMLQTSLSVIALAASDKFKPSQQVQSACTFSDNVLIYEYKPFLLFVSYGAALAVGLICTIIGFHAIFGPNSGRVGDTSFSGILAATRNESIDVALTSNARDNVEESLMQMRLRYGKLRDGRLAFGPPENFGH